MWNPPTTQREVFPRSGELSAGAARGAAEEHRGRKRETGRNLGQPHGTEADRVDRGPARERLEAERRGRDERAGDRPPGAPLLAEPAEERAGEDGAEEDQVLADEEPARVRQRVVRALGRAVGHEEVPD